MIPNGQFYLSQANTEFGGNGYASDILAKAGVPAPRLLSQLMGKSAFTPTHQLSVGVSAQSNSWGWNPVISPAYGNLNPKTSGAVTWSYLYVSTTRLTLAPSARITATFKLTFDNGATVSLRYNNLTAATVVGGDEAACIAKIMASVGQTIGIAFEQVA